MKALIVTLAEYQTVFWLNFARALEGTALEPCFLSFDDRSSEMIERAGFPLVSASAIPMPANVDEVISRASIVSTAREMAHERFAFNRTDTEAMRQKLAWAIVAGEAAIADARRDGAEVIMLQEVGGFLSVIGAYYAARASGIDNWFIEPSFFRGRLLLTRNSFGAPKIAAGDGAVDPAMTDYITATLKAGSLVIPIKDAHHYSAAINKIVNFRNAKRLVQKVADKYIFRQRQEFGFIGHHVASHVRMVLNSRALRKHYTPLEALDRFIYYPLHVPGDMALTLRSPEYLDQLALVDFLCRSLPDGYKLALKEHPAMVGAIASDRVIELLKRYDNLALLPPTTNNYAVMRKAGAVVTVNSKSGAEAGLLGKPVFVLGDAFYRDAPFAIPVETLRDLPAMLDARLGKDQAAPAVPAHIDWFANAWRDSRPGELYVRDMEGARTFAQSIVELLRV